MTPLLAGALGFGAGVVVSAGILAVTLAEDGGARRLYGRLRARRASRVPLPPPGPPAAVQGDEEPGRIRHLRPVPSGPARSVVSPIEVEDDTPTGRLRAVGRHRPPEERA